MKKTLATILFLTVAVCASAQDSYYAELLSRSNYYGTARSIALGNAMTALGGDLGSVSINPAGSAVNNFSQITFSPGLTVSTTTTSYSSDGVNFNQGARTVNKTDFYIPNFGMTAVFMSGHDHGLKAMSVGIIGNTTDVYQRYSSAYGTNSATSMCANLAAAAAGTAPGSLNGILYAGYNGGLFGSMGGNSYVGNNEFLADGTRGGYHYLPGELVQTATYNTYGTKRDLVVNVGFNFSDILYVGANIGLPSLNYTRFDGFSEQAVNQENFPVNFERSGLTYFKSASTEYKLCTTAGGIYGKIGVIVLPTSFLRIGAAFRTPGKLTVDEAWQYAAASTYANSSVNGSAHSGQSEYSYNFRTPYSANFGVALTLAGVGLLSVDYELTDYSVMRYSDIGYNRAVITDNWYGVNLCNKTFMGLSHNLRAGLEVKLHPMFSLRGGYSFLTSPERWWTDDKGAVVTSDNFMDANGNPRNVQLVKKHSYDTPVHSASLGFGYSSNGSFFADFAARVTMQPTSYYQPYFYGDYQAVDKDNKTLNVSSPSETISNRLWDMVLTMGWRF